MEPEATYLQDHLVLQDVVVAGEHGRVVGSDRHPVAGFPDGRNGLDVVEVAVGLQHGPDVESPAQFEQLVVLVGRVDQYRFAGLATPEDEDVVIEVAHHNSVDLGLLVTPVERHPGDGRPRVVDVMAGTGVGGGRTGRGGGIAHDDILAPG
jgi:hypothetical protein